MSALGTGYLVAYNVLQVFGWAYLLVALLEHVEPALKGQDQGDLYASVGWILKVFQSLAVLEIVHAAVGLVKSNVVLTFLQVFSRVYVTWAIIHCFPEAQISLGFPLLLLAWTITEIIRYSFYAFNLLGMNVYIITWLRYTLFIVLYPMGVTGELLCQFASLPVISSTGVFSVTMPNAWNFIFNFYYVQIALMLSYIPIFPQLYFHMFAQRKKIIGGAESKKSN